MDKPLAIIIEDDGSLADIYSEAIQAAGFRTEVIQGGFAAAVRVATVVPDLVILDMHLPTVPGEDILRQIHADERLVDTRVIVITGDRDMANLVEGKADMTFAKPIGFKELRDVAVQVLAGTEQTASLQ